LCLPANQWQEYIRKEGHIVEGEDHLSGQIILHTPKKRRTRRNVAPLVENSERRFTRSCLRKEGYRPKPVLDAQPKIKKKPRAKLLLVNVEEEVQQDARNEVPREEDPQGQQEDIPVTPIHVLQSVGIALRIAPEKLTRDQLGAEPVKGKTKEADNV
jgi:hypothetical protein